MEYRQGNFWNFDCFLIRNIWVAISKTFSIFWPKEWRAFILSRGSVNRSMRKEEGTSVLSSTLLLISSVYFLPFCVISLSVLSDGHSWLTWFNNSSMDHDVWHTNTQKSSRSTTWYPIKQEKAFPCISNAVSQRSQMLASVASLLGSYDWHKGRSRNRRKCLSWGFLQPNTLFLKILLLFYKIISVQQSGVCPPFFELKKEILPNGTFSLFLCSLGL